VIEKDLPPSVYTTSAGQSQKRRTKGFTTRYEDGAMKALFILMCFLIW